MSVAIAGQSLSFGYTDTVAIAPSSFTIPKGQITVVIGPNGSGKSTLLNGMAGLLAPLAGTITVAAERSRISYVLQTTKVNDSLPISVAEVVMMGRYAGTGSYQRVRDNDRRAVAEAMGRMSITDLAARQLKDLSAGQRQRAFVAQGLAQEHDLLLLDEPLTGVDLPTAQAIDEVIHDEIGRGCTVVMTSHDLSEAQVSDHVVLLSGRVVASGAPESALTVENLRAAYGGALLHIEEGRLFLDDAAHSPVDPWHVHRQRTIHTESSRSDLHGDDT